MLKAIFRPLRDPCITKLLAWIKAIEQQQRETENQELLSTMKHAGVGSMLWGEVKISGLPYMELGNNVHINNNAFIRAEGGLTIGDNTHISRNLVLYTVNHDYQGERIPYDNQLIKKSVKIGRNVWIGMNVCITPGTTIGDGAIIGMGTTVSGEVPPLAIIGSQKWRQIGQRDSSKYHDLDNAHAYGGANGHPFYLPE